METRRTGSQGCDSHFADPLAHLSLSLEGQRLSYQALHRMAHAHTQGRWIATGGGGYEWVDVVPLAWTHLLAEACNRPIDPSDCCRVGRGTDKDQRRPKLRHEVELVSCTIESARSERLWQSFEVSKRLEQKDV